MYRAFLILLFVFHVFAFLPLSNPNSKIIGINIGGWLVLEKFITPSMFANFNDPRVIDEWTIGQYYGQDQNALLRMKNHWDTWFTEADVQRLAASGFTHLRIPIGYWSVLTAEELAQNQEPFLTGTWTYFVTAIQWAKTHNLKVVVDLHAAPGSQNGWVHSGRIGPANWGTGNTIDRSVQVIEKLAQKIAEMENNEVTSQTIVGLELLNEAMPSLIQGGLDTIKTFYQLGYDAARKYLTPERYAILIEMAFTTNWGDFMTENKYQNVILDMHLYQCFEQGLRAMSFQQHLHFACLNHQMEWLATQKLPVIVGEWSLCYKATSDDAYLEPYPTAAEIEFLWKFNLVQMQIYSGAESHGFFFWNFKTESAPMWDWYLGVEGKWAPDLFPANVDVGKPPSTTQEYLQVIQGINSCQEDLWLQPIPYSTKGTIPVWNETTSSPPTVSTTSFGSDPTPVTTSTTTGSIGAPSSTTADLSLASTASIIQTTVFIIVLGVLPLVFLY